MKANILRLAVAVSGALCLTACASYEWHKIGANEADYHHDAYACTMEAAKAFPAALATQPVTTGYISPGYTNCRSYGGGFGCMTQPSQYVSPTMATYDANAANRAQAIQQCMMARGWRLVEIN